MHTNYDEVWKILLGIKNHCSTCHDGISVWYLKPVVKKTLDMNGYTSDFQQLPLNLVYSFDDPEDQVSVFNKSVVDCINTHAPLRKVKWRHFTISSYHQHIHWQYSFPSTWKIIDVCPVPKVDHAKDITEFRQISILCIWYKVFERVILHQLLSFFRILSSLQSNPVGISKRTFYNYIIVKIQRRY